MAMLDIRPSPIAGRWYPGNPQKLAESVDQYIRAAKLPDLDGQVIGVVAPHAGHLYSGPVAGHAFRAVQGESPRLVVVLSPSHQYYIQPLLTSAHEAYQTPLGIIPIDRSLLMKLDANLRGELGYGLTAIQYDEEHSLEIELPFLQRAIQTEFQLLPIMIRDPGRSNVFALAQALAKTLDPAKTLLVASTDLSHFYQQSVAEKLDTEILHRIEAFDPDAVLLAENEGKGFACGKAAVAAVLWTARAWGADQVKLLNYATSGAITGDMSSVVGYGAAAIIKSKK